MQRPKSLVDLRKPPTITSHVPGIVGNDNVLSLPSGATPTKTTEGPEFASLEEYQSHIASGFRALTPLFSDRNIVLIMMLADFLVLLGSGYLAGYLYHAVAVGGGGPVYLYGSFAGLVAASFSLIMLASGHYHLLAMNDPRRMLREAMFRFTVAFSLVVCVMFMAKLADDYSRATLIGQFLLCIGLLFTLRSLAHWLLMRGTKFGLIRARRVALVGPESAVLSFARNFQPWNDGVYVVATSYIDPVRIAALRESRAELLPAERGKLEEDCRKAAPDDVILVLPWDAENLIRDIVLTLSAVPAAIHIAPERMISWLQHPTFSTVGSASTIGIIRAPLTASEQLMKRMFDIVVSASLLVVTSPVLLLAAAVIKLQDGGPVFFRQARHGFNQKHFDIFKLRSMRVSPAEDVFRQATKADDRVTAFGRFLRASNIDELPQLINVLKGDMSLVGPRPHAVLHNEEFEDRIALYARRHNVKPGITGWAQVNGFRGQTDTLEKMDQRVAYDLAYIDGWSILLDCKILLMTVFSRKAYRNAH